jgi:hypothetical protein
MSNPTTQSAAHHMNSFSKTTDEAFTKCEKAGERWENKIKPLNERVGKSFAGEDDNGGLKGKIDKVTEASNTLKDKLLEEVHPTVSETWKKANNMTQEWEKHRKKINEVKDSYMNLATKIQETLNKMAKFNAKNTPSTVNESNIDSKYTNSSGGNNNSGGNNSSSGSGGNGIPEVGDRVTFTGQYYHDSWGKEPAGSYYSGVKDGVVIDPKTNAKNKGSYAYHIKSADGKYPDLGWVAKSQLSGYDTGGYTGKWGPEGKLAILHEKEIVLNKEDTENFLTATSILREIS